MTHSDITQKLADLREKGDEFLELLESFRTPAQPVEAAADGEDHLAAIVTFDRELDIAIERAEEALMWAEKHLAD